MRTILLTIGIICIGTCHTMQPDATIEELFKLCQTWFRNPEIHTIASHVERIRERRGSFINQYLVVQSDSAQAAFNAQEEVVNIHKIVFPGVPEGTVLVRIKFDQMLKIKVLLDSKVKK